MHLGCWPCKTLVWTAIKTMELTAEPMLWPFLAWGNDDEDGPPSEWFAAFQEREKTTVCCSAILLCLLLCDPALANETTEESQGKGHLQGKGHSLFCSTAHLHTTPGLDLNTTGTPL